MQAPSMGSHLRMKIRIDPHAAGRAEARGRRPLTEVYPILYKVKSLVWVGSSRVAIQGFPASARREAGHDLWLVQTGRAPRDWRPMPDVGAGVLELRVHVGTEHRVFYVAHFEEAIYVLHAFEKRSGKTKRQDLATGRARYRQVVAAPTKGRQERAGRVERDAGSFER